MRAHWLDIAIVVVKIPLFGKFLSSLRLVRLARLLRLLRAGVILERAVQAERALASGDALRLAAVLTVFVVVIAGVAEATFDAKEFQSVWDGIWWSVVTVTTVGYGDLTPNDVQGRIVAIVVMFFGIGFLSLLTATFASHFVKLDRAPESRADADRDAAIALRLDQAVIEISQEIGKLNERLARIETAVRRDA